MPDGSPRDPPTRLWVGRTDVGNARVSHIRTTYPQPCGWVARAAIRQAALSEYFWMDCASAVWAEAGARPRLANSLLTLKPKSVSAQTFQNKQKKNY